MIGIATLVAISAGLWWLMNHTALLGQTRQLLTGSSKVNPGTAPAAPGTKAPAPASDVKLLKLKFSWLIWALAVAPVALMMYGSLDEAFIIDNLFWVIVVSAGTSALIASISGWYNDHKETWKKHRLVFVIFASVALFGLLAANGWSFSKATRSVGEMVGINTDQISFSLRSKQKMVSPGGTKSIQTSGPRLSQLGSFTVRVVPGGRSEDVISFDNAQLRYEWVSGPTNVEVHPQDAAGRPIPSQDKYWLELPASAAGEAVIRFYREK